MGDLNISAVTGRIKSILYGKTSAADEACSFTLAIEKSDDVDVLPEGVTFVRVNAYGKLVAACKKKLYQGDRVSVVGELMNRFVESRGVKLTELRCFKINFDDFNIRFKETGHGERKEESGGKPI